VIVTLPGGALVRASPLRDRIEDDPERAFGLYMDEKWRPSWAAEVIEWEDFGVPRNPDRAAEQIRSAYERARRGELVEIGCVGGLGRTGTVLACMAILSGVPAEEAVTWVREHYDPLAVETPEQEEWVRRFAAPSNEGNQRTGAQASQD
jgi:protein-tyrosine phosphatase